MRILQVHNEYREPGGEDQVVAAEADLLRRHGHDVVPYRRTNHEIKNGHTLALAVGAAWNRESYREVEALLREVKPDVVHCHNLQPLISPAIYYVARRNGVPTVQTLHNFRLLCANALFYRDGQVCELCQGRRLPWQGIRHACYRDSRPATSVVVGVTSFHRALGTWRRQVTRYIALTPFARDRFIQGGLPSSKISVKPNCVDPDPGVGRRSEGYALFIGRLSAEKGVRTLLAAWKKLPSPPPLVIVGDGPLGDEVRAACATCPQIRWYGRQTRTEVFAALKEAGYLVFPSACYETFGLAVAEAMAAGVPIVCTHHGSAGSMVRHGYTGRHFAPGDADDLAAQVAWAEGHRRELDEMSVAARSEFESMYTAEKNYHVLHDIYRAAIDDVGKD